MNRAAALGSEGTEEEEMGAQECRAGPSFGKSFLRETYHEPLLLQTWWNALNAFFITRIKKEYVQTSGTLLKNPLPSNYFQFWRTKFIYSFST